MPLEQHDINLLTYLGLFCVYFLSVVASYLVSTIAVDCLSIDLSSD